MLKLLRYLKVSMYHVNHFRHNINHCWEKKKVNEYKRVITLNPKKTTLPNVKTFILNISSFTTHLLLSDALNVGDHFVVNAEEGN